MRYCSWNGLHKLLEMISMEVDSHVGYLDIESKHIIFSSESVLSEL